MGLWMGRAEALFVHVCDCEADGTTRSAENEGFRRRGHFLSPCDGACAVGAGWRVAWACVWIGSNTTGWEELERAVFCVLNVWLGVEELVSCMLTSRDRGD